MTSRIPVCALRPDFDKFLFATVGEEIDGIPLSVVSAFVRLGLDPWEEAGRLSVLNRHEAAEQLARLIAETPGRSRPLVEAREVAGPLVVLLPKHDTAPGIASQIQIRPRYLRLAASLPSPYWIIVGVLTAAALFSAFAHHGLTIGMGGPGAEPLPTNTVSQGGKMSVHLRIEETHEGVMATLSQRDDTGKVIGHPSVGLVASAAEARQLAKTLAQSLGLKVCRVIDKTGAANQPEKPSGTPAVTTVQRDTNPRVVKEERPPWLVPGVSKSL